MKETPFSLILLPTLGCNAACDYCFESKSDQHLTLDQLSTVIQKVMDHLEYQPDRNPVHLLAGGRGHDAAAGVV